MSRKNIWVFYQDGGTPAQGWGDRHYFLARHYDPARYSTTIFSANDCHMFTERVEFPGHFWVTKYDRLNYCWVKVNSYTRGSSKRRALSWLIFAIKLFFLPKSKVEKPDYIIVSSMPIFPILPALYYRWRWGAKLIFEVRDIWPLTIIEMDNYSPLNPFVMMLRGIEKLAYRKSDHLVSVLDKAHEHFVRSVRKPVDFSWISNGIDPSIAQKDVPLDEAITASIPQNKFIVGYAGKMSVSNALEFVIDAAMILAQNPEIHFVLIGDGDKKEELMQRASSLSNVTFLPKIEKHLIHRLISNFDVAIISFRKLGIYRFGISTNKLFDYMMAELPVIMASADPHEAYEQSGAIIRTEAENGQAIADKILEVSRMPKEHLACLGAKGRKFASENFLYEQLATRYERIFTKLDQ